MKPEKCAMMLNIAKENLISANQLRAFINYKNRSELVNGALSDLKDKGIAPTGVAKEQIDELTSYISTQQLPESIIAYRSEGYWSGNEFDNKFGCLRNCQLSGDYAGKTMDQVMAEIDAITDSKAKKQAVFHRQDSRR